MTKSRKRNPYERVRPSLILEAEELLDRFSVGNWIPNVDICETSEAVTVRVEVPGIEPGDIRLTLQGRVLRVQGAKKEPVTALSRLSSYCLERRYGKFDRQISIERDVHAGGSRATLENGILTIEIPRIENRRGVMFEIPIARNQK